MGFPGGSAGKESARNAGDLGLIPRLGRSPGEGNSYPLQYSVLENSMDCIVHWVPKSWTTLSHFHFSLFPPIDIFVISNAKGILEIIMKDQIFLSYHFGDKGCRKKTSINFQIGKL